MPSWTSKIDLTLPEGGDWTAELEVSDTDAILTVTDDEGDASRLDVTDKGQREQVEQYMNLLKQAIETGYRVEQQGKAKAARTAGTAVKAVH